MLLLDVRQALLGRFELGSGGFPRCRHLPRLGTEPLLLVLGELQLRVEVPFGLLSDPDPLLGLGQGRLQFVLLSLKVLLRLIDRLHGLILPGLELLLAVGVAALELEELRLHAALLRLNPGEVGLHPGLLFRQTLVIALQASQLRLEQVHLALPVGHRGLLVGNLGGRLATHLGQLGRRQRRGRVCRQLQVLDGALGAALVLD